MKLIVASGLVATMCVVTLLASESEPANRLDAAASVFSGVMQAPDRGIPRDLLANAQCIVIVPNLKTVAIIVGGRYWKGFLSCRGNGLPGWSSPAAIRLHAGSAGFQIAGSPTDLLMLVMSERGANELLDSILTLGAERSVAAGPVGRTSTAQTDAQIHADVLSWSRSEGLFAGVALEGATLRQDVDENTTLYGKPLENRAIVGGEVPAPRAAARLLMLLNGYGYSAGETRRRRVGANRTLGIPRAPQLVWTGLI